MAQATQAYQSPIEWQQAKANLAELRFRLAVITRAGQLARRQVKEDLRARGERPQDYTCAALTALAEDRVQMHLQQAAADIATFPEFAQWRPA
jgi:hypothetical protein